MENTSSGSKNTNLDQRSSKETTDSTAAVSIQIFW